jgi:hypothetical protein
MLDSTQPKKKIKTFGFELNYIILTIHTCETFEIEGKKKQETSLNY